LASFGADTKGAIVRQAKREIFYVLVSAKIATV